MHKFLRNIINYINLSLEEFIELSRKGEIDQILPGFAALEDCSQGTTKHLEGNVLVHTYLVFHTIGKEIIASKNSACDYIDLLAALVHDIEKPATRQLNSGGDITFPGHEAKAAERISEISLKLQLTRQEEDKLYYLVRYHGVANFIDTFSKEQVMKWRNPAYWLNLKIFQQADALSCWLNLDGSLHNKVHSELFDYYNH